MKCFALRAALLLYFAGLLPAENPPDWTQPFPPHHVIGNIYYVGSQGLASYLITTPQGHILINSSLEKSVPLIRDSIEKLGFKFSDIKILLISHAHWDHCAGSASCEGVDRAKYMVMDAGRPGGRRRREGGFSVRERSDLSVPAD